MTKRNFKRGLMASALTVMTLGMAWSSAHAQDAAPADSPADANEAEQATVVVVYATRDKAINAQMKAINTISVLSKDDLDHTAVHNVAEALGTLPGVNVMNTGNSFFGGIDGASRGEGMFVSLRGMNSEYNVNMINGVTVAQGMPYSRGVQLSLLPPSGLQTIVLNLTSTADMDGDAIGGTVDFRTPTAFNFAGKSHGSLTVSGRIESRARDYGDSGLGGGLAGEYATKFGQNEQFGFYGSVFYDERSYANSESAGIMAAQNDGGWDYLVTDASGSSYPGLDKEANMVQTGLNVGVSTGSTKRWGGNMSFDWKVDDTFSLYARASYARADTEQNSTLSQYTSSSKSHNQVGTTDRYALSVDQISTRVWYETNPEVASLSTFTLGGEKRAGAWTLSPSLFMSYGNNDRPDHIEASARINQSDKYNHGTTRALGGLSIGYDNDGFAIPLMTTDIYNDLNNADTALLARRSGQLTESFSNQTKGGFKLDARYDADGGALQYIKTGFKFTESLRRVTNRDWTNDHFANSLGHGGETWASLGIADGEYSSVFPGVYDWSVPKVNESVLRDYFNQFKTDASFDTCVGYDDTSAETIQKSYDDNYNCNTQKGSEVVTAAYVMADYKFGNIEVLPGVRYEHSRIDNTYWVRASDNSTDDTKEVSHFESNRVEYDKVLPSVFLNYRPEGNAVYRASIWTSYTRPPFTQLGGGAQTSTSEDGTTTITKGNPDLKAIDAVNYDLAAEWTTSAGGHAQISAYYKALSHYIFDNGSNYLNGTEQVEGKVYTTMPQNGGDGHVTGLEAQIRQKFTTLPGWMSGFGVSGNATRQWTIVDLGSDLGSGQKKPMQNAPEWLANASIFYEKYGMSIDLNYSYKGAYLSNYALIGGVDAWVKPTRRVDLHAGYKINDRIKIDLSVANLLKDYSYWAHIGKRTYAINDIVDTGRTTLLTVKYDY
jgi:TonB-dependent receptor